MVDSGVNPCYSHGMGTNNDSFWYQVTAMVALIVLFVLFIIFA